MAKRGRGWGRTIGGFLAAYLIALQAALSGLALGAAPLRADPLAVFCNPSGTSTAPAPDKRHSGAPDCCVAGCQMLGGGMAPPPALAVALEAPAASAAGRAPRGADLAPPASERTSRGARAPPV